MTSVCMVPAISLIILLSSCLLITAQTPITYLSFVSNDTLDYWRPRSGQQATWYNEAPRVDPADWRMYFAGGGDRQWNTTIDRTWPGLYRSEALSNGVWPWELINSKPLGGGYGAGLLNLPNMYSQSKLIYPGGTIWYDDLSGYQAMTNDVWTIIDGETWEPAPLPSFSPRQWYAKAVATRFGPTISGVGDACVYLMGGLEKAVINNQNTTRGTNDIHYMCNDMTTFAALPFPAPWSQRNRAAAVAYNGGANILLVGGQYSDYSTSGNWGPLNDVWSWDLPSGAYAWYRLTEAASFPAMYSPLLVVSQPPPISDQVFYILGGYWRPLSFGDKQYFDAYESNDGINWFNVDHSPSPRPAVLPRRADGTVAVNPTNNRVIHIGGCQPSYWGNSSVNPGDEDDANGGVPMYNIDDPSVQHYTDDFYTDVWSRILWT